MARAPPGGASALRLCALASLRLLGLAAPPLSPDNPPNATTLPHAPAEAGPARYTRLRPSPSAFHPSRPPFAPLVVGTLGSGAGAEIPASLGPPPSLSTRSEP